MAKKMVLQLTLVSGGKALFALTADAFPGVVVIGRDLECAWRPADADLTMRDRHATLTAKGDLAVELTPIDGAPITCNAHPFTGGKVRVGDRIAIGDSEIIVREVPKIHKAHERYHRLEGMNGDRKGSMFALKDTVTTVGSAEDNDIVIASDIVAAHHAEISIDERDAVWIKDLGSRNGTFVNGERMTDKARMIKNADVIGLSIWDFQFLDRTVPHVRSNTFRQLVIIAATVAVCLAVYLVLWFTTPTFSSVAQESIALAAEGKLAEAKDLMDKIGDTRGARSNRELINHASAFFNRWYRSWRDWEDFKTVVATKRDRNFSGVIDLMGRIRPEVADDWSWNPVATEHYMRESGEAEGMMSLYFTIDKMLVGHRFTLAESEKVDALIAQYGVTNSVFITGEQREWILPLKQALVDSYASLQKYRGEITRINDLVAACGPTTPELEKLVAELRKIEHSSSGYLRVVASQIADPIENLMHASRLVNSNVCLVANLKQDKVIRNIDFPTHDECMVHPHLGELLTSVVSHNSRVLLAATRLSALRRAVKRSTPTDEQFAEMTKLSQPEFCRKLLTGDAFSVPPPSRRRKGPVNDYDKYLGIEWIWGYAKQLPLSYPEEVAYEDVNAPEFLPIAVIARNYANVLRQFHAVLSAKEFAEFRTGELAQLIEDGRAGYKHAEDFVAFLDKVIAEEKDTRAALIAFVLKLSMMDVKDISEDEVKRLKELMAIRRAKVVAAIGDDLVEDEAMRKLAPKVLAEALPGDQTIVPFWKALHGIFEGQEEAPKDEAKKPAEVKK